MALAQYTIDDGGYLAQNVPTVQVRTPVELSDLIVGDALPSSFSTTRELLLPADAQVDHAIVTVTVEPGGPTVASEIAEIRDAAVQSSSLDDAFAVVVDFGRLVTLSDVLASRVPANTWSWTGDRFSWNSAKELRTERLLLEFTGAGNAESLGPGIRFQLPTIPSGLELAVDGVNAWFEQQGSVAGEPGPPTVEGGVSFVVDLTESIRAALAAKVAEGFGPMVPLALTLRASEPGHLNFAADVTIDRVHSVAFPEGPSRTVTVDEEGAFDIELPLPPESDQWRVDLVEFVGRASLPEQRVLPATGPPFSTDARLVLNPDRPVLLRPPLALLDRLATLSGFRLALSSESSGAELAGRLLVDNDGVPGEPIPGGDLTPAAIEPDQATGWVTLMLARGVDAGPCWLELLVSYGQLEWELTPDASAAAPDSAVAFDGAAALGAEIFRRQAGGAVRPLTVVADVGAQRGALRLIGVADSNRPIHGLALGSPVEPDGSLLFTPTRDGTRARIALDGLRPTDGRLLLAGVASVASSYGFESVRVTYTEASEEGV